VYVNLIGVDGHGVGYLCVHIQHTETNSRASIPHRAAREPACYQPATGEDSSELSRDLKRVSLEITY
jgi:hypothetical protein